MTLNREHALELLALLAIIALVQWPRSGDVPAPEASRTGGAIDSSAASRFGPGTDPEPSHRLDPIALLQASVPDDWRLQLPSTMNGSSPVLRC
jgi:hypothetical protein